MEIIVYLGLGANLGEPRKQLGGAREALTKLPHTRLLTSSALFSSAPIGGPEMQPDYFNAVLKMATSMRPEALLRSCLAIELEFGRKRARHWGPRRLDIDLLLYGELVLQEPELILPHPRLHQRRFVLEPLLELAPELQHPRLGRPLATFIEACSDQSVTRLGEW